jgi:hypothetical protein
MCLKHTFFKNDWSAEFIGIRELGSFAKPFCGFVGSKAVREEHAGARVGSKEKGGGIF